MRDILDLDQVRSTKPVPQGDVLRRNLGLGLVMLDGNRKRIGRSAGRSGMLLASCSQTNQSKQIGI